MGRSAAWAAALALGCGAAWAQPGVQSRVLTIYEQPKAATERPTPRVAKPIKELADEAPEKRAAARAALLAMGPGIAPQLQWAFDAEAASVAAADRASPAVQDQFVRGFGMYRRAPGDVEPRYMHRELAVLLQRCEERRRMAGLPITLRFTGAPVTEVLQALGRQMGVSVSLGVESGMDSPAPGALDWIKTARMTIDVERVSYWEALRTLVQAMPKPDAKGWAQWLLIGFDKVYLPDWLNARRFGFDVHSSTVSGAMLISATLTGANAATLTLRAMVDPGVAGLNDHGQVRIDAVTDDLGESLLAGDARVFVTKRDDRDDAAPNGSWVPSDGYRGWRVDVPLKPLAPGRRIGVVRGEFGIGAAPPHQSFGVALPQAKQAQTGAEDEVFVAEDCELLNPPGGDARPYRAAPEVCHREREKDTRRGRVDIEEQTYVLKNAGAKPVTFVVSKWLFGGEVDSEPKPVQVVADTAIFHAHAEPGEVVRLHVGVRTEMGGRSRAVAPPVDAIAPGELGRPVEFDGWTMRVGPAVRVGDVYTVTGEMSRPADRPGGSLYVAAVDAGRWTIVDKFRSQAVRQEDGRTIESFTIREAEPGRVPATLIWDVPEATHWFAEPFELHGAGMAAVE